jgi:Ni/Co efflux regulator RcnB
LSHSGTDQLLFAIVAPQSSDSTSDEERFMKRSRGFASSSLVAAALAVSLLTGSIAAQARDHDRDKPRHSRHDDRGSHERHARNHHDHDRQWRREHIRQDRWDDRRDQHRAYEQGYRAGRFDAGRYHRPAGYRHYAWHRGARLPSPYYAPRYVVHDYGRYRLHRPPHGHHWVRVDHDVVLAAVTTGAVIAVVHNLFH